MMQLMCMTVHGAWTIFSYMPQHRFTHYFVTWFIIIRYHILKCIFATFLLLFILSHKKKACKKEEIKGFQWKSHKESIRIKWRRIESVFLQKEDVLFRYASIHRTLNIRKYIFCNWIKTSNKFGCSITKRSLLFDLASYFTTEKCASMN